MYSLIAAAWAAFAAPASAGTLGSVVIDDSACPKQVTSIAAILSDTSGNTGRQFCVEAVAGPIGRSKPGSGKNWFTTVLRQADGATLNAFSFGQPGFSEGDSVHVCGTFSQEKTIEKETIRNELHASAACNWFGDSHGLAAWRSDLHIVPTAAFVDDLAGFEDKDVCLIGVVTRLMETNEDHVSFKLADAARPEKRILSYARTKPQPVLIGGKPLDNGMKILACGKYQAVKKTHKRDFTEFTVTEIISID